MPKKVETTVYQFDELADKAKEAARRWYREGDLWDPEAVITDAATIGTMLGIEFKQRPVKTVGGTTRYEPEIDWDLGQGGGTAFAGRYRWVRESEHNLSKHAPRDSQLKRIAGALTLLQEAHGKAIAVDITIARNNRLEFLDVSELPDNTDTAAAFDGVCEILRAFARWIHSQLSSDWDYQNSDEAVDENIRANEYEFLIDGRRA